MFSETLPIFLKENEGPVSILHVDCDLYSSTIDGLMALGPRIVEGSILIFDEFIMNAHWEKDEYKAFVEAQKYFGWKTSMHSFSLFSDQVVLKIESIDS